MFPYVDYDYIFTSLKNIRDNKFYIMNICIYQVSNKIWTSASVIYAINNCNGTEYCFLPAWKIRDRQFKPYSGIQVVKKQNVSSPLTWKKSILWGIFVTER